MGILGMMAAGGAQGLANASNQNVQAQNQLELENARGGREDRREALRQQYLERNFNLQRQDRKEQAAAQMQYDDKKYQREREDKMFDSENEHRQRVELTGMTQAGADRRSAASISAANKRAELRANATGGTSSAGDGLPKMASPAGKAAVDLIRLGLADNEHDAYNMALKLDIVKAAQQNPLTKINDDTLLRSVENLTQGLFPKQGGGLLNRGEAEAPEVSFAIDPRTGKLLPNGR